MDEIGLSGRQKLVLVAGLLAAAATVVFPPWGFYDMGTGEKTDSVLFGFIAHPPGSDLELSPERGAFHVTHSVQIEWFELAFRLVVVAILFMILFQIASRRPRDDLGERGGGYHIASRQPRDDLGESGGGYHVSRVFGPDD